MNKTQAIIAAIAVAVVSRNLAGVFIQRLVELAIFAQGWRLILGAMISGATAMAIAVWWLNSIYENIESSDVAAISVGFALVTIAPWIMSYVIYWNAQSNFWGLFRNIQAGALYATFGVLAGLRVRKTNAPRRGRPVAR